SLRARPDSGATSADPRFPADPARVRARRGRRRVSPGAPASGRSAPQTPLVTPQPAPPGGPRGLRRGIRSIDAIALVVGSMIGSGIFIVSAESARLVPSAGWLLLAWTAAGILALVGALSCAELAAMLPKAGGQYVFFREAYGPLPGFLFGWAMLLVIQTGTIAAVSAAFARF